MNTTENTEWQWPLSGVQSIMRVKSAQAGEGGGNTLTPFPISTITYKIIVFATQLRGQIHSPYISSTPKCTLWSTRTLVSWRAEMRVL